MIYALYYERCLLRSLKSAVLSGKVQVIKKKEHWMGAIPDERSLKCSCGSPQRLSDPQGLIINSITVGSIRILQVGPLPLKSLSHDSRFL